MNSLNEQINRATLESLKRALIIESARRVKIGEPAIVYIASEEKCPIIREIIKTLIFHEMIESPNET